MSCITKILELKGDKEVLVPDEKWIAVEGGGKYKDYEYLIVLNTNGHRCGYVAIPSEHPYSETPMEMQSFLGGKERPFWDYNKLDIECHGGLTFMEPNHGLKDLLLIPCNDIWIGFDCGHYGDACDIEHFKKYFGEKEAGEKESFFKAMNFGGESDIKDFDYVEEQCHHIIDQLIQIAA